MINAVLIESHYLPCLEYFCAVDPFSCVILEHAGHFVKQSPRNRCFINTSQGVQMLTVPLTGKHGKVPFRDIKIDFGTRWRDQHWRTICSAYARAPFFEHYADDLHGCLFGHFRYLRDLNQSLLSLCLGCIGEQKGISETVTYGKPPNGVFDLRSRINSRDRFMDRPFYEAVSYHQVFGSRFAENLSLIDLLFCEGPSAGTILKASRRKI